MTEGPTGFASLGEAGDRSETTVLVVDDESVIRRSFSLYLESWGYSVLTADSGEEALALVDDDVDVVMLDRRMPDTSGDQVLAEIRTRGVDCRIALVTAVDPDFDVVQVDCDDYLVKPVDKAELRDTVERLVLLEEYSDAQRELSSLRVKRNVLEVEKHPDALAESEEFAALEERIRELETELDEMEAAFDRHLGYEE
jgi:DNA-binding response OmpR family regulator